MGHRVTQRILECSECGVIPDDGEYMWEMSGGHWCKSCCEPDHEEDKDESS